jgi:predicted metalloprotease
VRERRSAGDINGDGAEGGGIGGFIRLVARYYMGIDYTQVLMDDENHSLVEG